MSTFWSTYIIVLTVVSMLAIWWLIRWTSKPYAREEGETTNHIWDEDLEEYNTPLPRWFLNLFYITVIFAVIYLILYPGLGNFPGLLGWTSTGQYDREVARADSRFAEIFQQFADMDIDELARDERALRTGHNLYMTYCSTCHGADARGAVGFPNLRDDNWAWGRSPEAIHASIAHGRMGVMPGWGSAAGEEGVEALTEYTLKLAGRDHDSTLAEAGAQPYAQFCASCHGAGGGGNTAMGAPDLTNNQWVWGGTRERIADVIRHGRQNEMPAQAQLLGDERVHVLAGYVYSFIIDEADEDARGDASNTEAHRDDAGAGRDAGAP